MEQPTFGEPLSEADQQRVAAAIEESARVIREYEEQKRTAPQRNFTAAAIDAGFTRSQAEFLWRQHLFGRTLILD